MQLLQVAIANTINKLLDYLPPEGLSINQCKAGSRVLVPFGSRKLLGIIAGYSEPSVDISKIKKVLEVIDKNPLFNKKDIELLLWASTYYISDPGEVFMQALPKELRKNTISNLHLESWEIVKDKETTKLSPAQKNAYELLLNFGGKTEATMLLGFGVKRTTLKSLENIGVIKAYETSLQQKKIIKENIQKFDISLTKSQQKIVNSIPHNPNKFSVSLLEGITGSGKTQVYIKLAANVVAQNKQVVILVPEIGLTPQTLGRFQQALNVKIVSIHSSLSDAQRTNSWQAMRSGDADILIGTRSAILPSCNNLGLIIVDEEHDTSYKQQSGFRYNARDIAISKAQYYSCPIILGSATPSLSSLYNISKRGFSHFILNERATGATLPNITLLDTNKSTLTPSGLAEESINEIKKHISNGKQVLIFVNKRGFAQSLFCRACGWQAMCKNCDARMTIHRVPPKLICHHCFSTRYLPTTCSSCSSKWLSTIGTGTEQISSLLELVFPDTSIIRIDQDSTKGKGQLQAKLQEIRQQSPAILVGTQMLAKGHDFPNLSLVVVLDSDNGLYSTDFYAIERTCQLLLQVAGRSGRHGSGNVIIQTTQPKSPYLISVKNHDYQAISKYLLNERKDSMMPPYSYVILIRASSTSSYNLDTQVNIQYKIIENLSSNIDTLGPFEPSISKVANKYRKNILLISNSRKLLHQVCFNWWQAFQKEKSKKEYRNISWIIDVDPYEVF